MDTAAGVPADHPWVAALDLNRLYVVDPVLLQRCPTHNPLQMGSSPCFVRSG